MKNKTIALLEIAIVLCSVFLVALPTIAAEQTTQKVSATEVTTTSEDDFVLGVYGNANEDDTIDMRDLTYVKLIFFGKKPETELADAKYDGKIDPLDFIQIKLIIVGKEKELTIVDTFEEALTVHKPVKHTCIGFRDIGELLRAINKEDTVVGTDKWTKYEPTFFPKLSKPPVVSDPFTPDYEAILSLGTDVYFPYVGSSDLKSWRLKEEEWKSKLPGVEIVSLDIGNPTTFTGSVRKLGYIFGEEEKAEELANWYNGYIGTIKSRTVTLSEDEKPRVMRASFTKGKKPVHVAYPWFIGDIAGGKNIADDIGEAGYVDPEWVMMQNPDIIIAGLSPFVPICGYEVDDPSNAKAEIEEILNRPELAQVTAVKIGKVYGEDWWHLRFGATTVVGVAYFAKLFHPDLFEDLDPEAIYQEYIDRFQHIDYDLDEHGVFFYPPIEIDGGLAGIPDRYKGQI